MNAGMMSALKLPDVETADPDGLVAQTDALDAGMLLHAYRHGVFPWSENPVRWYSPDPRAIFIRDRIHLPRNLPKLARAGKFRVTYDHAFRHVMQQCANAHREDGAWITPGFLDAYGTLHDMGYAHSVEVWQEQTLVGGVYGVQINGLFAGESMFHIVANASKVAFAALVEQLDRTGNILFDAQVINAHTARLGAVLIHRRDYITVLNHALRMPLTPLRWS